MHTSHRSFVICRHCGDSMEVGFTTTDAFGAYHHYSCELESRSWRGVLDTILCDKGLSVPCYRSVVFSGFLYQYNWALRYNFSFFFFPLLQNL